MPVARAYLDQLTRDKALSAPRAAAVKTALDHYKSGVPDQALTRVAADLERDAASASGRNAQRMHGLAETIKGLH